MLNSLMHYGYRFLLLPLLQTALFLLPFLFGGWVIRFIKNRIDGMLLDHFGRVPYFFFAADSFIILAAISLSCIWLVPSYICVIFASLIIFSTGYSFI